MQPPPTDVHPPRPAVVRRAARRVLGERGWEAVRAAYRAVRPRPVAPSPPPFVFPPDVADVDALRAFLADTDIFGHAPAEGEGYLADALERFRVTMAMLPSLPEGARVLELGANPYFLTRLLRRRGLDVTCANYFGEPHPPSARQVSTSRLTGEEEVFEFDIFNVERDRFPYDDGSFDLVLCCEILEHLPHDPTHMLAEIHRVLVDGGCVVVTTPNPVRWDNLRRIVIGENPYETLSGYGAYGRHNREYTVGELDTLLTEIGYEVERIEAVDVHPLPGGLDAIPDRARWDGRGDNLFALARARGVPCLAYPSWLYSSVHGYRRRVRDDVVVGVNDDVQTAGFHERDGAVRWTGAAPEATAYVRAPDDRPAHLVVEGDAPPPAAGGMVELVAEIDGVRAVWKVSADGSAFSLTAPYDGPAGEVEVRLVTDRTWTDGDRGGPARGVAVRRVAIEAGAA
jgi:SAM-dependent methyltransferase